jgi:hypothetical protein
MPVPVTRKFEFHHLLYQNSECGEQPLSLRAINLKKLNNSPGLVTSPSPTPPVDGSESTVTTTTSSSSTVTVTVPLRGSAALAAEPAAP